MNLLKAFCNTQSCLGETVIKFNSPAGTLEKAPIYLYSDQDFFYMSTLAPEFDLKFVTGNDDANNAFQGVSFKFAQSGADYSLEIRNHYNNQFSSKTISSHDFAALQNGMRLQRTTESLKLRKQDNDEIVAEMNSPFFGLSLDFKTFVNAFVETTIDSCWTLTPVPDRKLFHGNVDDSPDAARMDTSWFGHCLTGSHCDNMYDNTHDTFSFWESQNANPWIKVEFFKPVKINKIIMRVDTANAHRYAGRD